MYCPVIAIRFILIMHSWDARNRVLTHYWVHIYRGQFIASPSITQKNADPFRSSLDRVGTQHTCPKTEYAKTLVKIYNGRGFWVYFERELISCISGPKRSSFLHFCSSSLPVALALVLLRQRPHQDLHQRIRRHLPIRPSMSAPLTFAP